MKGERIRLKVLGISCGQIRSGASALILAQIDGPLKIPIVIGTAEAQSIAMRVEGVTPARPFTHDLFTSFAHAFGIKLKEVFIYKFEDGIFSSELTFSDGERQISLDSRTSDAIAIAMRTNAPIYVSKEVLDETGYEMNVNMVEPQQKQKVDSSSGRDKSPKLENYAIEELERTLAKLIENEEYEKAAKVKTLIELKRNGKNTDIESKDLAK